VPRTARLTRDDWADAALRALAEGGVEAVAVEPIAARLNASKSSFYWLFSGRPELLAAALARWEHTGTDRVIAALEKVADPAERMRVLIRTAFAPAGGDLALRLIDESGEPAVRAAVERVTRRRLDFLEQGYADLGLPAARARDLAAASYAVFLGTAALRRLGAAPADRAGYTATLMAAFGVEPSHGS
jgi:AcrR family transcriptional regulator